MLERLSKQTIEELHRLANHFENGISIDINHEEKILTIIGHDTLNEQGNIILSRNYDCDYGYIETKWFDTSDEMMQTIYKDDRILKKSDLYTKFEDSKKHIKLQEGDR